jgi:hypothetical protein
MQRSSTSFRLSERAPSLCSFALFSATLALALVSLVQLSRGQEALPKASVPLPTGKVLFDPLPDHPQPTNNFPTAMVLRQDGRYLALLNNGRGT